MDGVFYRTLCWGIYRIGNHVKANPVSAQLWQVIISKYHPTFLGDCQKAIDWSEKTVSEWLCANMLSSRENPADDAKRILDKL